VFRGSLGLTHVALAIIIIIVLVGLSPSVLIYDEVHHIVGARLLVEGSTIRETLLDSRLKSAAGPLYFSLHAFLFPVTEFQAPYIRGLNVVLLIISIAGLSFCIKFYRFTRPVYRASAVLSVPIIWVCSGLALTEIPAFTMATFSLLSAMIATKEKRTIPFRYLFFVVSGLFAGLAIMGRQTYLPMALIFVALAAVKKTWFKPAICSLLLVLLISLPVFIIWGGLTSPGQAEFLPTGSINILHGLIALGYLGIIVMILAPAFFEPLFLYWKWFLAFSLLTILANMALFQFTYTPISGLVNLLPFLKGYYELLMGSLIAIMAVMFVSVAIVNVLDRPSDKFFLSMVILTIVGASTAFGITHAFSSRYLMACFPFVLLMVQPFYSPSLWAILRFSLGGLLGIAMLGSYYDHGASQDYCLYASWALLTQPGHQILCP